MASVSRSQPDYLESLSLVLKAAQELIEESECWVTESHEGCGRCHWCSLADAVDRAVGDES